MAATRDEAIPYDTMRDALADGDIVMCVGNGPMSRLIRWLSKSRASHAGIIMHWHDRILVAEATGKHGVHVWPLSNCVRKYDGRIALYRPTPATRARADLDKLRASIIQHLGTGYRTSSLFQIGWHLLWSRPRAMKDPARRPPKREFVCSELVAACYRDAGVDLVPDVPDGYTTPGDLERSPALERVGRLQPSQLRGRA
ncbi:MAG: hypothetical protein IT385_24190 [Deltaproteobacteria bacterium]|nr:hypothetical protein [Deltaproteobacteria bacterium]